MIENHHSESHPKEDFDPQSPQYQLHPEHPPNKASTWKLKTEDDGWVLIVSDLFKSSILYL